MHELEEAPLKDLPLCLHVVLKTLNLEISSCRMTDCVKENCT